MAPAELHPIFLEDAPVQADEHLRGGIGALADNLRELIPRLPQRNPILIAGPWGSGKTTLLRALQRRFKDSNSIWFEAWRCETEGLLLPALVRCVWQQSPAQETERAVLMQAFQAASVLATRGARVVAALAGLKDVVDAIGSIKDVGEELAATGETTAVPKNSPADQLHDALAQMIERGWPESNTDPARGPVIFIDDLDRCSPDQAVAFVEQLRAIVVQGDSLPCRFVLAIDREILVRAITSKFGALGVYDGNRYLEKVFPFVFTVPAPSPKDTSDLLMMLMGDIGISAKPEEQIAWRNALSQAFAAAEFANPRRMKRCINRFLLVQYYDKLASRQHDGEADTLLAEWLAATEHWPTLRGLVSHSDESIRALSSRVSTSSEVGLGADLDAFLNEPGAAVWLKVHFLQKRDAYRKAELRLRQWGL